MKTQTLVDEFLQSRRAANLSPVTIDWYRGKLAAFAQACPDLPLVPGPIEAFLASIKGCPETRHAYFRSLRAFYRFIAGRHEVKNPMDHVCAPRLPRKMMVTLDTDQLAELLSAATDPRAKALLSLMIDTGVRSSEAAGIRREDIKEHTILVDGKTGQREVPISDETRDLLLTLAAQRKSGDRIFQGKKGPLDRDGIYRIVSKHMKKAAIEGAKRGGHRLRHSFGHGYVMNGGDLRSLQEIMGHASITTTQKYVYLDKKDIIRQHQQYSPLTSTQRQQAVGEAERVVRQTRAHNPKTPMDQLELGI